MSPVHKQLTRYIEDAYQRAKVCEQCGIDFIRPGNISLQNWKKQRYCSRVCFGIVTARRNAEKRLPIQEKFELFFEKGEGCWEWQGTLSDGYGILHWHGRDYRAHVLALKFDGRPVPSGMMACHHCDNRRCTRPSHLYVGTAKQNAADASARNPSRTGSNNCNAKLTEADIVAIRSMKKTHAEIAKIYGVSKVSIDKIFERKSWRHVK